MKYRVEIAFPAIEDAREIYVWLRERSLGGATRWFKALMNAIDSLEELPERCSLAPENLRFKIGVRQMLIGKRRNKYRILFVVSGDEVRVFSIRHSARKFLEP